jgi:DNA polymerase-1
LKPALLALHGAGVEAVEPAFDTMIAAYLLNPNRRGHALDSVALEVLGYQLGTGQDQQPKQEPADLFDQPAGAALTAQATEAASVTVKMVPVLKERLEEQGSLSLFETIEMPLVPVLAEIERNGFGLDIKTLHAQSKELERELEHIMGNITRLAGQEFNVNSPKQLATVLFDRLGLKPIRKTKTGYSTDEDTLTQLAVQHELPAQILNYRSISKLKSTYVDAFPALVNPDTGRLHTSLNQTVAATGRLSSTEPNLQNIPIKGEHGFRIREAFVASRGHTLLCADYSQIEPRILAHLSGDQKLKKVFERGEDIHTATAVEIFKLSPENITREMRRIAKTVVFGIVYGISPFGLAQNIGVSQTDAKKYIDMYFERYAGVKAFIDRTIAEAKEKGYTTTITGRRRPIPELQSSDPAQRSYGERQAVNSPIQGSAADVIKVAMIDVNKKLHAELPTTKMILQVHDELIFEVPEKDLVKARHLVKDEMEGVGPRLGLSVPLKVELGTGHNWREAHP